MSCMFLFPIHWGNFPYLFLKKSLDVDLMELIYSDLSDHLGLQLLPFNHRSLGSQFQDVLVAAMAAAQHLPRQPSPVLPRQFRL